MSDELNKRPPQHGNLINAFGVLRRGRMTKKICAELTAACLIAGAFMLSGCPERSATGTTQDRAYKRVMDTKTLRVAYISYPPSFIKDANTGAYSGIMHEVLHEMARRMDLKVDYAEE